MAWNCLNHLSYSGNSQGLQLEDVDIQFHVSRVYICNDLCWELAEVHYLCTNPKQLYIMKTKNFLLLVLCTLLSVHIKAADGDTFTANTSEGIEMTFRVISETEKTARVAIENGSPAISQTVTGTVTIPSEVTYNNETYTVTLIGLNAFYRCYGVTSISIPNTVEAIGNYAFSYCI